MNLRGFIFHNPPLYVPLLVAEVHPYLELEQVAWVCLGGEGIVLLFNLPQSSEKGIAVARLYFADKLLYLGKLSCPTF